MKKALMRNSFLVLVGVAVLIPVLAQTTQENPFFTTYQTPYGVPPFDQIKLEHYLPAYERGIAEQAAEVSRIASNRKKPTFENTIAALEYSGQLLSRVGSVFSNLNGSHTNKDMQALERELSPKLSAHRSSITLNEALFRRVKTLYDKRDKLRLNPEQMRLLEKQYKNFVRGGAMLQDAERERLKAIDARLAQLTLEFGQNVLAETNSFELVITDKADLSGLPADVIEGAAAAAKRRGRDNAWVFTLHNPSVMPFLQYADNRSLREKIWRAYINRGNNDNKHNNTKLIPEIVSLRQERANMLGYPTHAAFVLEENMAQTPAQVSEFLEQLWRPAIQRAGYEAQLMQKMIAAEGKDFQLEAWDWRYYAEKIRREQFALDNEALRAYFPLDAVMDGMFDIIQKLWGLQVRKRDDIPKYHDDVMVYEVQEADGSHVGIIYFDLFNRESKRGGAWMSSFRGQRIEPNGEFVRPVVVNVCNFTPPTANMPSLLTMDEVETLFHEFGHGLHGLLSQVTYPSLSGTSVPRDFVELPSQIMENWARDPKVIPMYAKHYKTGESIPQELVERMKAAGTFNQGFETTEYLASSILDMKYHNTPVKELKLDDVDAFERKFLREAGMPEEIVARHRSTYFNHVFSGGYSAGYYSYIWSAVLDADAYEAFVESGNLFNKEIARAFRENVLSKGGTVEPKELYRRFRGDDPKPEPLLRRRGLIQGGVKP